MIPAGLFQVIVPQGDHLMRKGVSRLRPVQGDDGHMVFYLVQHVWLGHNLSPDGIMSDDVAYADLYDLSRKAGFRIEEREGKLIANSE